MTPPRKPYDLELDQYRDDKRDMWLKAATRKRTERKKEGKK